MITFYPGPSKVYPQVGQYAIDAIEQGIVSLNHRSPAFMKIVEETMRLLRDKLAIPTDYHIAFTSSATECWEIVAQSLTTACSFHLIDGAFSKKWFEYTKKLKDSSCSGFAILNPLIADFKSAFIPFGIANLEQHRYAHRLKPPYDSNEADVLCITQNETSNGTQVPMEMLATFRREFSGLIAVDAVSSMAGIALDWALADVWFASVQKCFGLPAGLAVLIYSPNALKQAEVLGERTHYNSLLFIHENFAQFQTPYTPNGLGIYLLMRVLEQVPPISELDAQTRQRALAWYRFFDEELTGSPFRVLHPANVVNGPVRSDTVIAIEGPETAIKAIKEAAKQHGITLGNGYGAWKNTTFRIANFPAIAQEEIDRLKAFIVSHNALRA